MDSLATTRGSKQGTKTERLRTCGYKMIEIELASEHKEKNRSNPRNNDESLNENQLVSPGDVITRDVGFMRGHGTYMKSDVLYASVAGVVQRVNKLISVTPLKTKYAGEIGDVIVGRVTEVQQKRWKVDTNSRLDSVLLLSSVNLPGGELRRRSSEDELAMRSYLQEGDLISAEVQQLYSDGAVSLHTRSLKYGKLSQGTLVKVSPSLIKRRKTHFHKLPCGVSVILGNNGFVWISPTQLEQEEQGGFAQNLAQVPRPDREAICRLRSCVLALAGNGVMLWDTTLSHAYDASAKYHLTELLRSDVMADIANLARQHVDMES